MIPGTLCILTWAFLFGNQFLVYKHVETSTAFLFASYIYSEQIYFATYQHKQLVTISQTNLNLWILEGIPQMNLSYDTVICSKLVQIYLSFDWN